MSHRDMMHTLGYWETRWIHTLQQAPFVEQHSLRALEVGLQPTIFIKIPALVQLPKEAASSNEQEKFLPRLYGLWYKKHSK